MGGRVFWNRNGDEGVYVYRRFGRERLSLLVYRMGESEAELAFRREIGRTGPAGQGNTFGKKSKIRHLVRRRALRTAKRLLERQGLPGIRFVAEKGSRWEKTLRSTGVVREEYREYLLRTLVPATGGQAGAASPVGVCFAPEKDGFFCWVEQGEPLPPDRGREDRPPAVCRLRPYRDGYYLYEVAVREDLRGRGLGTAFLTEVLRRLSEDVGGRIARGGSMGRTPGEEATSSSGQTTQPSSVPVYLQVGSYNPAALQLYRKLGFQTGSALCYFCWAPHTARNAGKRRVVRGGGRFGRQGTGVCGRLGRGALHGRSYGTGQEGADGG